jgi:hypothetical protein
VGLRPIMTRWSESVVGFPVTFEAKRPVPKDVLSLARAVRPIWSSHPT